MTKGLIQHRVSQARKLIAILSYWPFIKALAKGCAAGTEHLKFLRRISPATVIDVGANRGQFALAARKIHPKVRIISFEPLLVPAKIFQHVFEGDPSTKLVRAALGREETTAEMNVAGEDDSSSLFTISERQVSLYPKTARVGRETVSVGPLELFVGMEEIKSPALLKIDVQGYEGEVLEGCQNLLECFDWVYVECSFLELYEGQPLVHDIIRLLSNSGFRFAETHNLVRLPDGSDVQADFLFMHELRADAEF